MYTKALLPKSLRTKQHSYFKQLEFLDFFILFEELGEGREAQERLLFIQRKNEVLVLLDCFSQTWILI